MIKYTKENISGKSFYIMLIYIFSKTIINKELKRNLKNSMGMFKSNIFLNEIIHQWSSKQINKILLSHQLQ